MELYFLRHGEADWPNWKKSDDERPLTKRGKEEIREVAKFLVRVKAKPSLILTSPLPRASQTAEIAAEYGQAPISCKNVSRHDMNYTECVFSKKVELKSFSNPKSGE